MNKSTTIICGQETVDCTKIPIYVLDDKKITTINMYTCSDLYSFFRKRFIKNNKKYKHYYNEYDLPHFYFTYNGKPLYDSDVTISQLNIHPHSYIQIHYVGLLGGVAGQLLLANRDINPYFEFYFMNTQIFIDRAIQDRDSISDAIQTFLEFLLIYPRLDILAHHYDTAYVRVSIVGLFNHSVFVAPPHMWRSTGPDLNASGRAGTNLIRISIENNDFNRLLDSRAPLVYFRTRIREAVSQHMQNMELQSGLISSVNRVPLLSALRIKLLNIDRIYVEKLIEDLVVLLNGLRKFYSTGDKTLIFEYILIFLKLRNNDSLISVVKKSGILSYVETIINELNMSIQSGPFDSAKELISKLKATKQSVVSKTLYRVSMFALSISLFDSVGLTFDKLGYSKFEQELLKKKFKFSSDLALDLAEGLVFLLEKGYQIILTKSLDPLYHSVDEYAALYDTITDLKQKQHALCNPEAFGFSESWYVKTLDDTIEKLQSICKYAHTLNSNETKVFKYHLNELQLIKINRVIASAAQETREVPFSLLFFAQPGVGKSSLTKITFQHFGVTHNLETEDCYLYTRNPAANFADGFSQRHWAWLADDIAFKKVSANPQGDPTTDELIQLINAVPFVPDQAAIENKGKIPARPKLVMGTTNIQDMNAYHYFSCPAALQRRFPYVVTVAVKEQYQKNDGSGMLDSQKATHEEGYYPDFWVLKIQKVKVPQVLSQMATYEDLLETSDINEFCAWISKTSKSHFEEQKKMMNSLKEMKAIKICHICYKNEKLCMCESQSGGLGNRIFHSFCLCIAWVCFYLLRIIYLICWERFYLWFRERFLDMLASCWLYIAVDKINKLSFTNFAHEVRSSIGYPKVFGMILTALVSSYSIIKFVDLLKGNQGSLDDSFEEQSLETQDPKPLEKERHNPWIADDFRLMNMDLTQPILSSKQFSRDEFLAIVDNNVFSAKIWNIDTPKEKWLNNILCVRGNVYLTNAHFFDNLDKDKRYCMMQVTFGPVGSGVKNELEIKLDKHSIHYNRLHDLAMFIIPHAVPRKNILNLFPRKNVSIRCTGTLLTRLPDGRMRQLRVTDVTLFNTTQSFDNTPFDNKVTLGICEELTQKGDCGSPLVLHSPKGHFLVSIHRAGNPERRVSGTCIFIETLEDMLNIMDPVYQVDNAPPNLLPEHMVLQSLHEKSVFNYIEEGSAEVYGSLGGFKRSYKSRVCDTPMSEFLGEHSYTKKYTAPTLTGWQPWHIAATALTKPVMEIDVEILTGVTLAFLDKIKRNIPLKKIQTMVTKYDQFTSLNGAAGVAYVDKINRNTSAGYPFSKSKRHFLIEIPPERGLQEPVTITPEMQERVNHIVERYKQGLCANPVFIASLKDEPVSFAKAKSGKTRVFGSAPMDWTIVVRQYLLSVIRLIQNNKLYFETAIGTVAQSGEWGKIYKYLTTFGKNNMVAGDFKNFDKQMSPIFIRAAFEIIYAICEASGNYDAEDLAVIRCIAIDTAYPLMDFNGDLVRFFGSNPSGHSLTVIINSLVNSLYMRYVFVVLYRRYVGEASIKDIMDIFDTHVRLITYGDDNVLNISLNLRWYNHTTIAEAFAELGIVYTMPDKEAESVPYVHISQVSFLKRTWRFDKDANTYLAPLEHDSIEKMLMTWVASDTLDSNSQCLAVISSAIREYFFYGREIFEVKRELFVKLLIYMGLGDHIDMKVLPTYELLMQQYRTNTLRIMETDEEFELQSGFIYDGPTDLDVMYFLIFYSVSSFWFLHSLVLLIFERELDVRGFYAMFILLTYLALCYAQCFPIFFVIWLLKIRFRS